MDFHFHGFWRMDWGLGNPNKTAVLIACLMIGAWAAAWPWRMGFWWACLVNAALGGCLVHTYSRGGLLAASTGIAVLLASAPRLWPTLRLAAGLALVWFIGAAAFLAEADQRYAQGILTSDPSIHARWAVWRHFPELLAAAPWGWGWGRAGDAYTQWFQPPQESDNYLNLLSTHFTWMAEGGWLFSVLYLAAWVLVISACLPVRDCRFGAVPLAVWLTFALGGCFSQVADSPWLWVLPVLALAAAVHDRWRARANVPRTSFAMAAALGIVAVAILVVAGKTDNPLFLRKEGPTIALGRGPERIAVAVDRTVFGQLYGHTLRRFLAAHPSLLDRATLELSEAPAWQPPADVRQLILTGDRVLDTPRGFDSASSWSLVLANPMHPPDEIGLPGCALQMATVYFGEYSASPARAGWAHHPRLHLIAGAAEFLPAWPATLLIPPQP
jgi:hypothetical protein